MTEPRRLPVTPKRRAFLPLAPDSRAQDRRVRPRVAVWELTLHCNLSCEHCGSRAGKPREGELSTEECLKLVDELADLEVLEVSLIGGEAHLHPGFFAVLRALKARGIEVGLTTGGRGIDVGVAREMAAAGLDSVSVSVDGLRAAHDAQRALVGAFDAAMAAIQAFHEASVFVSVNTQINRVSSADLEALFELIAERGARAWQIALTVPMGRAADHPDWLLQPADLLELFPRLAALKARCDAAGIRLWPGNNVGYFGPYEHALRGQMPLGHAYSCGAGVTTLGIESDGTIKGCPSLPSEAWVGGNVREHSLAAIWERAPTLRYVRDRDVNDLWGFCRTCYYADECRAGCTWTSFSFFGKPGNNPYCHHRALEMAARGERERLVRVEAPPGEPFDTGRFEIVMESASSPESTWRV